jgi:hypothetical protein
MSINNIYPHEHFIQLEGLSPFLIGRIVINKQGEQFSSEIDIVQSDSGKIYNHVAILYGAMDAREALDLSVHRLSRYLQERNI